MSEYYKTNVKGLVNLNSVKGHLLKSATNRSRIYRDITKIVQIMHWAN